MQCLKGYKNKNYHRLAKKIIEVKEILKISKSKKDLVTYRNR